MRKLLLIPFGIFALIVGFAFASKAQNKPDSATARKTMSSSAVLYSENCASCHGADLNGGAAKSLSGDNYEFASCDEDIIALVKSGNETIGMPAFGTLLSDAQILDIIKYAKSSPKMKKVTPATVAEKIDPALINVETWVSDLKKPWSLTFINEQSALMTEVSGELYQVEGGVPRTEPVENTPAVWASGQGGLLDVAIAPDFPDDGA